MKTKRQTNKHLMIETLLGALRDEAEEVLALQSISSQEGPRGQGTAYLRNTRESILIHGRVGRAQENCNLVF